MGLVTPRSAAGFAARRTAVHSARTARSVPMSARRRAMVLLGITVLTAAILGTIVGHVLSASAPM